MHKWDPETRRLSRKLLREIVRLETPAQNWEVSRGTVGSALGMDPDDLYEAAHLLVDEGMARATTSDLFMLKATASGRRMVP